VRTSIVVPARIAPTVARSVPISAISGKALHIARQWREQVPRARSRRA